MKAKPVHGIHSIMSYNRTFNHLTLLLDSRVMEFEDVVY